MRARSLLLLLACAGGARCTPAPAPPPPSLAALPPNAFPGQPDQDLAAIDVAANAFVDAARTYGDPAGGARAAAALDYLAGALAVAPRWQCGAAGVSGQMLAARLALRAAIDVPADAPSQQVVDGLLAAADALRDSDPAAARRALAPPTFPDATRTLAALGQLPYIATADLATQGAQAEVSGPVPGSTCFGGA